MTQIIDTVTDYEDKVLQLMVKIQDEVLGYVKQAVSAIEERLPELELPESELLDQIPTLEELVTTQFAFSKKVLANQEKFAKNVVKTIKPLTRDGQKKTAAKTGTAKTSTAKRSTANRNGAKSTTKSAA